MLLGLVWKTKQERNDRGNREGLPLLKKNKFFRESLTAKWLFLQQTAEGGRE